MALYRTGTATMDAQGVITGTGTKWREPLSLIRTGATIVFLTTPLKLAVISDIVSDTEMKAIQTDGEPVENVNYVILLNDSLTVDGMAQDVAETLRYYQSKETVIEEAIEFFKNFDLKQLQDLIASAEASAQKTDADRAATEQLKNDTQAIKDAAVNETQQIKEDTSAIKNQTQNIKDSAVTETEAIKQEVFSARDQAELARDAAENHAANANNARSGAENARDEAHQWAQQINPENLLNKDQNLNDVPNKDEARIALSLERFGQREGETVILSPDLIKYITISNNSWGCFNSESGWLALGIIQGGTGSNSVEGARSNLRLGPNDQQIFKSLTLNGKDYSFTVDGGEQNHIQMYAARNPPLDDWANFTRYNWYNDLSASGSVRSGSDKIKCHRIRVDSPSIDTSDFDFYPTGYLKARAFNAGTATSHYGWGIEKQDSGNAIPFNAMSAIGNNGSFAPVVAGGSSTPGGWHTRFAIGMISPGATGWSKPVIKVLGDDDKHRVFEFGVDGGLVTWQASPNDLWGGNYDFAKNPTSDRDLKHDIQYTDGKESYDRVMQWLPTMFKYNGSDIQRFGLIAQDLLKIDPQYVKLVPGSPVFEDVIGVDENGEEYIDRQIETDRKDDTLALDSNVMLTDMACAMVYMGNEMENMKKEIEELKETVKALLNK